MPSQTIETRARTTKDGRLNLSVNLGIADADVAVVVAVTLVCLNDVPSQHCISLLLQKAVAHDHVRAIGERCRFVLRSVVVYRVQPRR
jgi:hypothetical protein